MPIGSVAAILANLDHKVSQIEKGATEGLVTIARRAAQLASDAAPVESGALRDSWLGGPNGINEQGIEVGTGKHGPYVRIGSDLPYASKIEYEDVPMLRPAIHQAEVDFHETIKSHIHTVTGVM